MDTRLAALEREPLKGSFLAVAAINVAVLAFFFYRGLAEMRNSM